MKKNKSDEDWTYAHHTFRTGTRTFQGVEFILSNMIDNFDKVTRHSCGSFSTTNDLIARNAISDTAIVMSYSLLEGFFHEEFNFYIKNKNHSKPKELKSLIGKLLREHDISIEDWRKRRNLLDILRILRNAVTHSNGIIEEVIDREKCTEIFGEDIFESDKNHPRLSLPGSLWLLQELRNIAEEYSEAVFIGSA